MRHALLLTGLAALIALAGCGDATPRTAAEAALGLLPTAPSLSIAVPEPTCGVDYAPLEVDGGNVAHASADENENGWICERSNIFGPSLIDDSNTTCSHGQVRAYDPDNPLDGENGDPNGYVCLEGGVVVQDDFSNVGCNCGEIPDPPVIVCPAGYEAFRPGPSIGGPIGGGPGGGFGTHPDDLNGNGYLCRNADGDVVDDIVEGEPPVLTLTAGKVNGHGVYTADGGPFSFSFHARSDGSTVEGTFEFHDRDTGARYHGEMTCLEVDAATALLEGVITNARNSGLGVGTVVTWIATDNGEGSRAPPDEVSGPETRAPEADFAGCGLAPTAATAAIDDGNVQVH